MKTLDTQTAIDFSKGVWKAAILPVLFDYIRIQNKSQDFDSLWRQNGHMERAVLLIESWCRDQPIDGLKVEVVRLLERTPLLFLEIPATDGRQDTVLLYGHLDKQPECGEWRAGLSPWTPVLEGDRLYGRGGADDGYAVFASLAAVQILINQGVSHARIVIMIEAGEESGSPDLEAYIDHLAPRIGEPSLVICLDSGGESYDRLWTLTSLRGVVSGKLRVEVLREGRHSGYTSGVVPSSFRIVRQLLSRIENEQTGEVIVPELRTEIPPGRIAEAKATGAVLGDVLFADYPFVEGVVPVTRDPAEAIINRTWRPALTVPGADGLPAIKDAGAVLRPFTEVKVSVRIPPRVDYRVAGDALRRVLEAEPPYNARVTFTPGFNCPGWDAPPTADWLGQVMQNASLAYWGNSAMALGAGGAIPFMEMMGKKFPCQMMVSGVLGPDSNSHGPNEFLHVGYAERLTCVVAEVIAAHAAR